MAGEARNDSLTPIYIEEQLVFVPLFIFYMGAKAIDLYIQSDEVVQ